MPATTLYIIDVDSQERESEATRRLLSSLHKEHLLVPMGLGTLSWVIMEAQKPSLVPGIVGDVDILAGTMEFSHPDAFRDALEEAKERYPTAPQAFIANYAGKKVAEDGGIKWPPEPSYVVGVEVKCAYFDTKPKSTKSSPEKVGGIRKQIDWLLNMGLDRVALLDVIANPPSDGIDSAAWLNAAGQAQISLQAMKEILRRRLPDDSPSGQFVWSVGPVVGGDERIRGAGVPLLLRQPLMNPGFDSRDQGILSNRKTLLGRIPRILEKMPTPRYFPIVFIDCQKCRRLHGLDDSSCRPAQAGTSTARSQADPN